MLAWFGRRYLDLLGSIYIYNEHRGYTAIMGRSFVATAHQRTGRRNGARL